LPLFWAEFFLSKFFSICCKTLLIFEPFEGCKVLKKAAVMLPSVFYRFDPL